MHCVSTIGGIIILACALLRAQDSPSFAKDVAPIFAANCAGCHGANVRMGSLSLDSYEGVEKGGNHGKVIEAGKSAESRLFLMITGKLVPPCRSAVSHWPRAISN